MKNKLLLVAMAKLLKIDQSVIEAELEKEDGDDSIIKEYQKKFNAYSAEELARLIANSNKSYLEKADFEVNEVPKNLYDKIKGAAFEKFEKGLAEKHGIDSYDNLNDLISKLSDKSKTDKGEPDEMLLKQIETLKDTVKAKETELETERQKMTADYVNRDFSGAVSSIPLDYEEDAIEKQRKLLISAFNNEYKLERRNDLTIVLDSEGKPVVDKLGDPKKISDVIKDFAVAYDFKIATDDKGGRGTGGSPGEKVDLKGKTFEQYCEAKGVAPMSAEGEALFDEYKAANQ